MQADMIGDVHIKLKGKLVDLLTKLEPDVYSKYLQTVYVKLRKELYGTFLVAMLF